MKHRKKRKSKKKTPLPKVRHGWEINPKTRVKPSAKIYKRSKVKRKTNRNNANPGSA